MHFAMSRRDSHHIDYLTTNIDTQSSSTTIVLMVIMFVGFT